MKFSPRCAGWWVGDTDPLSALHTGFLGLDWVNIFSWQLCCIFCILTQTKSRVGLRSCWFPELIVDNKKNHSDVKIQLTGVITLLTAAGSLAAVTLADLVIVSKIYKSSPTKKFFFVLLLLLFYFRATQSGIKLKCLGFNFILSTMS